MKTKKKIKKKVSRKRSEMKKEVVLVRKLKAIQMNKSEIARHFGYESHNTITNWFLTNSLPVHLISKVKTLVSKKA